MTPPSWLLFTSLSTKGQESCQEFWTTLVRYFYKQVSRSIFFCFFLIYNKKLYEDYLSIIDWGFITTQKKLLNATRNISADSKVFIHILHSREIWLSKYQSKEFRYLFSLLTSLLLLSLKLWMLLSFAAFAFCIIIIISLILLSLAFLSPYSFSYVCVFAFVYIYLYRVHLYNFTHINQKQYKPLRFYFYFLDK